MEFKTLSGTPITILTNTFNAAFADYELDLRFTEETLLNKIKVENIDLSVSVAAFDGGILVGFIFFAIDNVDNEVCAWDGGTGVIPAYRGQKLTQRMFGYILPTLRQLGTKKILLEVLTNNTGAYAIYERIGFRKKRELFAYKGMSTGIPAEKYDIEEISGNDMEELLTLGDWQPAWQQMNNRVRNWSDAVSTFCIKENNKIAAYVHYNKNTGRILQFAVAKQHRRKGMASALFHHLAGKSAQPVTIVNVDADSDNTNAFLKTLGMQIYICQYEMAMTI